MNSFMRCLDDGPAPFNSRLNFQCGHCGTTGSRNASYHPLPGCVPGFFDKCPTCHSTDVTVVDMSIYASGDLPS
jgi:hypothetical protein